MNPPPLSTSANQQMRDSILRLPAARRFWTAFRARHLLDDYARRRDRYAAEAARRSLVYREATIAELVRQRIRNRGYAVQSRRAGEIHTFAAIPMHGWHEHLMPDLGELGPVSHFDYIREGFSHDEFSSANPASLARRQSLHNALLESLAAAQKRRPVDWAFFYGGAPEVMPLLMQTIERRFGVPTVNMSLDDKQGFDGPSVGECRANVVDITRWFDLYVTSARVCCEWHLVEEGRRVVDVELDAPRVQEAQVLGLADDDQATGAGVQDALDPLPQSGPRSNHLQSPHEPWIRSYCVVCVFTGSWGHSPNSRAFSVSLASR